MNRRNTLNQILLAGCGLLLASTHALADRPALSERTDTAESEIIDISTDLEAVPVFEESPAQDTALPAADTPATADSAALEALPDAADAQTNEPEPVIHVYDHRTETEIKGDVITLKAGETLPVRLLDFPRRGMAMDKVRNELGEPHSMSQAIGEPPITSWTYRDRIVYFEYASVVHVVATP